MFQPFKSHIEDRFPFLNKGKILIAVSGGLDSTVLTHLCKLNGMNIALAHCNFNLRGDESALDEDFVMKLGTQNDLEVFVQHFDTKSYADSQRISVQMAARELRYQWFEDLADQLHFDYILTAHHTDDDLETFLINLSRGTGMDGLKGIPEQNGRVIRPLLEFSRNEIYDYAVDNDINWQEDSSNISSKYLRNKIRKEVIPELKAIAPDFLKNFKTTQRHIKQASQIVSDGVEIIADQLIEEKDNDLHFDISVLKKLKHPNAYLYELLKPYGFTQWEDVYALPHAQAGKQLFSNRWRLLKDRDTLILSKINSDSSHYFVVHDGVNQVDTPAGILLFEDAKVLSNHDTNTIYVDKQKLQFPLVLRKWVDGDLFYPFGLNGKKKLSKYFKDEKLSLIEKENTWLLCSEDTIVWVIGRRADDRFKVTENTKHILKIELI